MGDKKIFFRLFLGVIMVYMACGLAMASSKVRADGMLSLVEEDGAIMTVMIDDKGYLIDPSARILDREGKIIALHKLSLPTRVEFEYEYTKDGPVIRLIVEYPDPIPQ